MLRRNRHAALLLLAGVLLVVVAALMVLRPAERDSSAESAESVSESTVASHLRIDTEDEPPSPVSSSQEEALASRSISDAGHEAAVPASRSADAPIGEAPIEDAPHAAGTGSVRVRVVGLDGRGLANARVRLYGPVQVVGMELPPEGLPPSQNQFQTTNSEGECVFGNLPPGHHVASMQNAEPQLALVEEDGEATITLRAFPNVLVYGIALEAGSRRPVEGLRIGTEPVELPGGLFAAPDAVTTNAEGRFEIEVPRRGKTMELSIARDSGWILQHKEPNPRNDAFTTHIPVPESATELGVELTLDRAAMLHGRVLEPDGETPAPRVNVNVQSGFLRAGGQARTDDEGRFRYPVRREDVYTVRARRADSFVSEQVVVPAAGDPPEVVLVLGALASVDGVVTYEDGSPAADLRLNVQEADTLRVGGMFTSYTSAGTDRLRTDENGYYYVDGIRPGEVHISPMTPEGYIPERDPAMLQLEPGEYYRGYNIVLKTPNYLHGSVTNANGDAVPGAQVNIRLETSQSGRQMMMSDAEGLFRIPMPSDLDIGAFEMTVSHPRYVTEKLFFDHVPDEPIEVSLHSRSPVYLEVVDESGDPVTAYIYEASVRPSQSYQIRSQGLAPAHIRSHDGRTMLPPMEQGVWHFLVSGMDDSGAADERRGGASLRVSDTVEEDVVRVILSGGRSLAGRVLLAEDRSPVSGAAVVMEPEVASPGAPLPAQSTSDADGRFRVNGLLSGGSYRLRITTEPAMVHERDRVSIPAGGDHDELEILMMPPGVIYGRCIGFDGAPLAGAQVMLSHPAFEPGQLRSQAAGPDGSYRFEGLSFGRLMVMFAPADGMPGMRETVELGADNREVEVNFNLAGKVLLSGDVFVNGARVATPVRMPDTYLRRPGERTGAAAAAIRLERAGGYQTYVEPGIYDVSVNVGWPNGIPVEEIEIPRTPHEQTRDIRLELAPLDIVLVYPEYTMEESGTLSLIDAASHWMSSFTFQGVARRYREFPAGVYTFEYRSASGRWKGRLANFRVVAGQENSAVIDMEMAAFE